jgi:hypothetical protein
VRNRYKGVSWVEKAGMERRRWPNVDESSEPRRRTHPPRPVSGQTMQGRWADPGLVGPSAGRSALLEQLGLGGWLEAGDAAEVGRWASLGKGEGLGPQTLVRRKRSMLSGSRTKARSYASTRIDTKNAACPRWELQEAWSHASRSLQPFLPFDGLASEGRAALIRQVVARGF